MTPLHKSDHGTFKSYLLGLTLCVGLTLIAYFFVEKHLLKGATLIGAILGLGLMQVVIQLVLFLHLGQETKPRFKFMTFLFMALVVITVVGGSVWIMYNLNQRMMPEM